MALEATVALLALSAILAMAPGCGGQNTVRVRVGNFVNPYQNISVTLGNSHTGPTTFSNVLHQNYTAYRNISLTTRFGPGNFWNISVLCPVESSSNVTLDDFLFLNSSLVNASYTVTLYSNCTIGSLSVWSNITIGNYPTLPRLGRDQGLLMLSNHLYFPVNYSSKSDICYQCVDTPLGRLMPGAEVYSVIDTRFGLTFFLNHSNGTVCQKSNHFAEYSIHSLMLFITMDESRVAVGDTIQCRLTAVDTDTGINPFLPILYAAVVMVTLAGVWVAIVFLYKFCREKQLLKRFHFNSVDRVCSRDLGSPKAAAKTAPGAVGRGGGVGEGAGGVGNEDEQALVNQHDSSSLNHSGLHARGTVASYQAKEEKVKPKKFRLASLDTFRGLSLIIMVFVNYGGGGYWFFNHSAWNGLTVADLVFPWFVWIMGVSIVFSFRGRRKDSFLSRLSQVLRRSAILFALGLFLNNGVRLAHWRVPGVLQRFAISYFVVALTELFTSEVYARWKIPVWAELRDVAYHWVQWVLVLVLETLWLGLTLGIKPDNCPRGYLGPGGSSEWGAHANCTGGAAALIDRWLFSEQHIYQTPTCKLVYGTGPYDPEGALGALNSIVICLLGAQAGRTLTHFSSSRVGTILRLCLWGVVLGVLGAALSEGQMNEGVIPINKNLWSLSFILVMAGSGSLLLAVLYLLIDVLHLWNGAPFKYPGMNSIVVYVGSELLQGYFPFSWSSQGDSHAQFLSANLVGVACWLLIAYYWHWIGFFVKI